MRAIKRIASGGVTMALLLAGLLFAAGPASASLALPRGCRYIQSSYDAAVRWENYYANQAVSDAADGNWAAVDDDVNQWLYNENARVNWAQEIMANSC
jgi:hypothetical protein